MKKIFLLITLIGLSFGIKAQTSHLDGQTKLVNPTGRTLIIEKDDDDSWLTFHDPGQYWYSMGIDKSNSGSFSINTGGSLNSSQFVMNTNGKIGIGTITPKAILDVGKFIPDGAIGTIFGRLPEGNDSADGTFLGVKGHQTQGSINNIKSFSLIHNFYGNTNSSINFYRGGSVTGGFLTFNTSSDIERMRILGNGNVGIGTTTTGSHKLAVEGSIGAREIKVEANGWSDFVFYKDYKLPSLTEVEKYIKEKGHLKDIPSAKEVEENGILLGEMNSKLLQKIEELTLYTIQQDKRLNSIEFKNLKLEKENESLKTINSKLLQLQKRLEKLEKK
jgi:hypothetical protein